MNRVVFMITRLHSQLAAFIATNFKEVRDTCKTNLSTISLPLAFLFTQTLTPLDPTGNTAWPLPSTTTSLLVCSNRSVHISPECRSPTHLLHGSVSSTSQRHKKVICFPIHIQNLHSLLITPPTRVPHNRHSIPSPLPTVCLPSSPPKPRKPHTSPTISKIRNFRSISPQFPR